MSVKRCAICGKFIGENDDVVYNCDGVAYHRDCVENSDDYFICENCGKVEKVDNMHDVIDTDGYTVEWCDYCYEYRTITCDECGATYSQECTNINYYEGLDRTLDDRCYDQMFDDGVIATCADCGEVFYTDNMRYDGDDGEWYCDDCYEDRHNDDDEIIRDYHHNPAIKYFPAIKDDEIFKGFGIELEVSGDNADPDCYPSELAEELSGVLNDHAYYMHDGSIGEGVEIITQPHTMDEFLKLPWRDILKCIRDHGYRSHDAKCCGLHMHISRAAMTQEGIARIIYFYEHYINDIIKVSRRTRDGMSQWASTYGWGDLTFAELAKRAADKDYGDHSDRYHAVNLTNRNTVEFRLMRGTLNYDSFMATIDFLWTTAMNANTMSDDDITNPANFLKGLKPDTIEYIKRRNAFVGVV